jgi:hypothetical protein
VRARRRPLAGERLLTEAMEQVARQPSRQLLPGPHVLHQLPRCKRAVLVMTVAQTIYTIVAFYKQGNTAKVAPGPTGSPPTGSFAN